MVKVIAISSMEAPLGTPSSWMPLSEAREDQPKEATAISWCREVEGCSVLAPPELTGGLQPVECNP